MKTEYYGTYTLRFDESHIRLDYKRTLMDYWNILVKLGLALFLANIIFNLFEMGVFKSESHYLNLLLAGLIGLLGFLSYVILKSLFYSLSSPAKNLVHMERETGIMRIKLTGAKEYILFQHDLLRIEYELTETEWPLTKKGRTSHSVTAFIRTKDRQKSQLLHIKETSIGSESKEELLKLSKKLTKRLAQLLNITAKRIKTVKEAS